LDREPALRGAGAFEPPDALREEIEDHRTILRKRGSPNETQALYIGEIDLEVPPETLEFQTIEYAAVRAIRARGKLATIMSVASLPVCAERQTLFMHARAADSDLEPSRIHTFSGSFVPGDGGGLTDAALRELEEESGLAIKDVTGAQPCLFHDLVWGPFEFTLLGVPITGAEADLIRPTEEGEAVPIAFDDLEWQLIERRNDWASGGRMEVLAWLALGAAPLPPGPHFGGKTAMELFDAVVR
jgi:hypothetical protein